MMYNRTGYILTTMAYVRRTYAIVNSVKISAERVFNLEIYIHTLAFHFSFTF